MNNVDRFIRVYEYIRSKGKIHNKKDFAAYIQYDYTNVSKAFNGKYQLNDMFYKIHELNPEINLNWLNTGEGNMLDSLAESKIPEQSCNKLIPFFSDIPMSAGTHGRSLEVIDEIPSGFMDIPSISAKYLFPVIGYSMLPRIKPGDIIGVNNVQRWDRVEPDKIYLIITNEERMIKRLRIDNENEDILWCVSDNYKEFKININEIKHIYHVVYHGELL